MAGAVAKIKEKVKPGLEPKENNFGPSTMRKFLYGIPGTVPDLLHFSSVSLTSDRYLSYKKMVAHRVWVN